MLVRQPLLISFFFYLSSHSYRNIRFLTVLPVQLYSAIIFDLLRQITARATASPPDSTLLII